MVSIKSSVIILSDFCCQFLAINLPTNVVYRHVPTVYFLKKWANACLFLFIFVFSNKHYKFYNKYECEKMSIQYPALGFELTTL